MFITIKDKKFELTHADVKFTFNPEIESHMRNMVEVLMTMSGGSYRHSSSLDWPEDEWDEWFDVHQFIYDSICFFTHEKMEKK